MDACEQQSIFVEVSDFLVSQPNLEELVAYQVSSSVKQHIDNLMQKNREQGLSRAEQLEIEHFFAISRMMTIAKVKAKLKLIDEQTQLQLNEAIDQLPDREAHIIRLRIGLAEGRYLTLEEVGAILGVARERIRQLQVMALNRLEKSPIHSILEDLLNPIDL